MFNQWEVSCKHNIKPRNNKLRIRFLPKSKNPKNLRSALYQSGTPYCPPIPNLGIFS